MKFDSRSPFKFRPSDPQPLSLAVKRVIRFGECDPMGICWHGNYVGLCEEAREALADACGITYGKLLDAGVMLPVKNMFLDYLRPLRHNQEYLVRAVMHWADAARLNITYSITDKDGELCTTGFSVQLMVDTSGNLLLDPPALFAAFARDWAAGKLAFLQNAPGCEDGMNGPAAWRREGPDATTAFARVSNA